MAKMNLVSGIVAAAILAFSLAACPEAEPSPNTLAIIRITSDMWDEGGDDGLVLVTATNINLTFLLAAFEAEDYSMIAAGFSMAEIRGYPGASRVDEGTYTRVVLPLLEMNDSGTRWSGVGSHNVWLIFVGEGEEDDTVTIYRSKTPVVFRGGTLQLHATNNFERVYVSP